MISTIYHRIKLLVVKISRPLDYIRSFQTGLSTSIICAGDCEASLCLRWSLEQAHFVLLSAFMICIDTIFS